MPTVPALEGRPVTCEADSLAVILLLIDEDSPTNVPDDRSVCELIGNGRSLLVITPETLSEPEAELMVVSVSVPPPDVFTAPEKESELPETTVLLEAVFELTVPCELVSVAIIVVVSASDMDERGVVTTANVVCEVSRGVVPVIVRTSVVDTVVSVVEGVVSVVDSINVLVGLFEEVRSVA